MSKSRSVRRAVAWGLIGAIVVGLGLGRAGRADDGPKKVALLVDVNRYRTRILVDKRLSYAERDVEELAKVQRAQGFEVRTLIGNAAGKQGIDAALDAVLKGREAADLVLLGFAGHGVQMPLVDERGKAVVDARGKALGDAYFGPVDAVFGRGESMVSLTRLFERLDREGGINLMLVDACRDNPDPERSLGGRVRSLSGDELNGRLPGNSAILFSCSAGQRSLETAKAGGGHGVFIHHVIEGLKGRAALDRERLGDDAGHRLGVEVLVDPLAHLGGESPQERPGPFLDIARRRRGHEVGKKQVGSGGEVIASETTGRRR